MERAGRVELHDLQLGRLLRVPCAVSPLWLRAPGSHRVSLGYEPSGLLSPPPTRRFYSKESMKQLIAALLLLAATAAQAGIFMAED